MNTEIIENMAEKKLDRDTYRSKLRLLENLCSQLGNTPMLAKAKIDTLVCMLTRFEKNVMLEKNLNQHPYILTAEYIDTALQTLNGWQEISHIEHENKAFPVTAKSNEMEKSHEDLFQKLWTQYSPEQYKERIAAYKFRLEINELSHLIKGKSCIDFGCGHGNFAHALLECGAKDAVGIDIGVNSIEYASRARDNLGVSPAKLKFVVSSVYKTPFDNNSFDFAIQNGVFHHLDDENAAYREVYRTLKPGGWFWVYTDGEGGIVADLFDSARNILDETPINFIINELKELNLNQNKRYHFGDGLNAVYRRTSLKEITERLSSLGFGNFKRLRGGFPYDYDLDVIQKDQFGIEKFGEGDLRLLCQKI